MGQRRGGLPSEPDGPLATLAALIREAELREVLLEELDVAHRPQLVPLGLGHLRLLAEDHVGARLDVEVVRRLADLVDRGRVPSSVLRHALQSPRAHHVPLTVDDVLVADEVVAEEYPLSPAHGQLATLVVAVEPFLFRQLEQARLAEGRHTLGERSPSGSLVGRPPVAASLPHRQEPGSVPDQPPHGRMLARDLGVQPLLQAGLKRAHHALDLLHSVLDVAVRLGVVCRRGLLRCLRVLRVRLEGLHLDALQDLAQKVLDGRLAVTLEQHPRVPKPQHVSAEAVYRKAILPHALLRHHVGEDGLRLRVLDDEDLQHDLVALVLAAGDPELAVPRDDQVVKRDHGHAALVASLVGLAVAPALHAVLTPTPVWEVVLAVDVALFLARIAGVRCAVLGRDVFLLVAQVHRLRLVHLVREHLVADLVGRHVVAPSNVVDLRLPPAARARAALQQRLHDHPPETTHKDGIAITRSYGLAVVVGVPVRQLACLPKPL